MKAFTLVELIIVLVVVGILSVSAAPLFIGTDGIDSVVLRERAKSVLRNIQLSAMQRTTDGCKAAYVTSATLGRPEQICGSTAYTLPSGAADSNDRLLSYTDNTLTVVSTPSLPFAVEFGPLGKPQNLDCTSQCQLTFNEPGGASASLCINKEGYIYDC
ncbi:MAG: prepilin-type N-terminal cleavage/methylation domain-containing protein [Pseudomonadota bacterium]